MSYLPAKIFWTQSQDSVHVHTLSKTDLNKIFFVSFPSLQEGICVFTKLYNHNTIEKTNSQ